MAIDMRAGLVRILAPDGTTAGVGFVVSEDGLVVTCSHVIQDEDAQQRGDPIPGTVRFRFLIGSDEERSARVEAEYWRARDKGDIAILRIGDGLPEEAASLPLGSAVEAAGHRFHTRGFRGEDERAGDGHILGLVPVATGLQALQLRSQEATQGYSGAPIWDEETGRVVGMMSDIAYPDEHGRHRDTAFATPSESLRTVWPSLIVDQVTPSPSLRLRAAPRPSAAIVGRDRAIAELLDILVLPETRLVTLTGPGGIGKSRLAVEIASLAAKFFPAGVVYVDLAQVVEVGLIFSELLNALGIPEKGIRPADEQVRLALSDARMLVIFDNFEHVAGASKYISWLISCCRKLCVMVTSRSRLRVSDERVLIVKPLDQPLGDWPSDLESIQRNDSVELFLRTIRSQGENIEITHDNAEVLADIARILEGNPLAILLAAARAHSLSLNVLLTQIQQRPLELLTGGHRDSLDRQRNIRATISWSHELLDVNSQALLGALSIFASPQELETIGRIADVDMIDLLDQLESLVDNNLVETIRTGQGRVYYTVGHTVREFAAEELARSPQFSSIWERYRSHFCELAQSASSRLRGKSAAQWIDSLDNSHAEFRNILNQSIMSEDWSTVAGIASYLWRFWYDRGLLAEGSYWCEWVIVFAQSEASPILASVLHGSSQLAIAQSDYPAAESLIRKRLEVELILRNPQGVAISHAHLAEVWLLQGRYSKAHASISRAIALFEDCNDESGVAYCLNQRGKIQRIEGRSKDAIQSFTKAADLRSKHHDLKGEAWSLHNLAISHMRDGRTDTAVRLFSKAIRLRREVGDYRGLGASLERLGDAYERRENLAEAKMYYLESLSARRASGDRLGELQALERLAALAASQGHVAESIAYYRDVMKGRRKISNKRGLDKCLFDVSQIALSNQYWKWSSLLYGAALSWRSDLEYPLPRSRVFLQNANSKVLVKHLGEELFEQYLNDGSTMMIEDALRLAMSVLAAAEDTAQTT